MEQPYTPVTMNKSTSISYTQRPHAILLLGPTGSGKTPLGEFLAGHSPPTYATCSHFDFGAELRQLALTEFPPNNLTSDDLDYVRAILTKGELLPDDKFYIAESLLRDHIHKNEPDCIILNGLPRHTGQAEEIKSLVNITDLIHLHCPAEVIFERIRRNSGGDRTNRTDDVPALIEQKLATYQTRTAPLLDFYKSRGTRITSITITTTTSAPDIREEFLNACNRDAQQTRNLPRSC